MYAFCILRNECFVYLFEKMYFCTLQAYINVLYAITKMSSVHYYPQFQLLDRLGVVCSCCSCSRSVGKIGRGVIIYDMQSKPSHN